MSRYVNFLRALRARIVSASSAASRRGAGARTRLGGVVVLVTVAMIAGCRGDTPHDEEIRVHETGPRRIGVVLPHRVGEFMNGLEAGIRETAERAEYTMEFVAGDNTVATQLAQLDQVLARSVEAVLLVPVEGEGIAAAAARVRSAGVPLFTAHRALPDGGVVSHTASDDYAGGWLAAEYMATWMEGNAVVAVVGRQETPRTADRERGFRDGMRQHREIRIVAGADGGRTREAAQAATSELLGAHRDIKAIFAADAELALGALAAAQGRLRSDVIIIAQEDTPEITAAIRADSPIKATLAGRPRDIGRRAVEWITAHFADQPVPPLVLVPVRLVNADSLGGHVNQPPLAGSSGGGDTMGRR